jgi:hypothetical protein
VLVLLAGLAPGTAAAFSLFSVREPVYAVVGSVLLVGEAIGHWDRAGTLAVHSTQDETLRCAGTFRYTGLKKGVAGIHCTDGSDVDLEFEGLGPLSGFGQGSTPRGTVWFTFGLAPEAAAPYLHLPAGKRIALTAQGAALVEL